MFQVTFSAQSLRILNDLSQGDQLKLMDTLSSLSNDILSGSDSGIGKFNRNGKLFYRLRIEDFRIYFEKIDIALHCHFILPKNSFNDFIFRCKLPSSGSAVLEDNQNFWDYLESLSKK
tara:strand:+ start:2620 stop:2973 length:354 start_codon:yes stop_codon:yes gene_type:complete